MRLLENYTPGRDMRMHSYENSRPYGKQLLASHRAGHLALPKGFFTNPILSNNNDYRKVHNLSPQERRGYFKKKI